MDNLQQKIKYGVELRQAQEEICCVVFFPYLHPGPEAVIDIGDGMSSYSEKLA